MNTRRWIVKHFDVAPHVSVPVMATVIGATMLLGAYLAYLMVRYGGEFGPIVHWVLSLLVIPIPLISLLMVIAMVLADRWRPAMSSRVARREDMLLTDDEMQQLKNIRRAERQLAEQRRKRR